MDRVGKFSSEGIISFGSRIKELSLGHCRKIAYDMFLSILLM